MRKLRRKREFVLAGIVASLALGSLVAGALCVPAMLRHRAQHLGEPQEVVPRVLYRSRQPRAPIAEWLRRHGIVTVVNLRTLGEAPADLAEERQVCEAIGARFVRMPIHKAPTDEQMLEFLRLARSPACQPVLVHCEFGKARAGMVVAAYRIVVDGWSVDRAVEEMRQYRSAESFLMPRHRAFLEQVWKDRQRLLAETAPPEGGMTVASHPRR